MSYFGLNSSTKDTRSVNANQIREENSQRKIVSSYAREYKHNTSSISFRQNRLRESLLAYTERLQSLTKSRHAEFRKDNRAGSDNELVVRANRIKKQTTPSSGPLQRRILSLDELLNRSNGSNANPRMKSKPNSPEQTVVLPKLHLRHSFETGSQQNSYQQHSNRLRPRFMDNDNQREQLCDRKGSDYGQEGSRKGNVSHGTHRPLPPINPDAIKDKEFQPASPKDICIVLTNKASGSSIIMDQKLGKSITEAYKPNTRKRRVIGNGRRFKRLRLPTGVLDSIPEADKDSVINSASYKSSRNNSAAVVRSSKRLQDLHQQTKTEQPPVVKQRQITGGIRFRRKRERETGHDADAAVPQKRPHKQPSAVNGRQAESALGEVCVIGSPLTAGPVKTDKLRNTENRGARRLVFLRDSPDKRYFH